MKNARLDQILLRLRYATQDQITRGLQRQKAHGGRLGLHLVRMGFISEHQLVEALAEQAGLSWAPVTEASVPRELVSRMPPGLVGDGVLLPLAWDESSGLLTLAVAEPQERETLERVRGSFGARRLKLVLAPESEMQAVGRRLAGGGGAPEDRVTLPELFRDGPSPEGIPAGSDPAAPPSRRVLLVTRGAAHRNFLPPVLVREGVELVVLEGEEEVAEALSGAPFDAVLVSPDLAPRLEEWIRSGRVPRLRGGVMPFTSVASALLDHPVPYDPLVRSLRGAAEALAEARGAQRERRPPWTLLARDAEALGRSLGLSRVALDALHLAVHLLLPPAAGEESPLGDFDGSRELALRLRFHLPLERLLDATLALLTGNAAPAGEPGGGEADRMPQVLALVWHHHLVVLPGVHGASDPLPGIRKALLAQASRLASLEVVELFLQLVEERGEGAGDGKVREVLVVGGPDLVEALTPRLGRAGCVPVSTDDLADAQTMAQRRPPAAVVVEHDRFPGQVAAFSRVARLDTPLLLYVVTAASDPGLTLSLLDAGAEDVFTPPHDFDVITARITRGLRAAARTRSASSSRPGGGEFAASFSAFSFLDLIQTLGHGLKSVRVELTGNGSEEATIYLERGRLVHAQCGPLTGVEAVYRVITWEEDGAFAVHPETSFPPPTIAQPIETVLMEGCRLLDESRV